tara:strand:- start:5369 stop:6247 length:879 start_codon:yes stop_codon:yes gene_type:complete
MYKVKLYGAKEYWCQVPRIEQGFKGLGHEVVCGDDYDFIYCNNFDFGKKDTQHKDSALYQGDSQFPKKGFKIFNVLDIPPHNPDFPIDKLKDQLIHANVVTCISEPVKKQLSDIGIESHNIGNPIKDIFFDPLVEKTINCLYVGRANDPNKRIELLNNIPKIIVGPIGGVEPNNNFLGLVNDMSLNELYNKAKIVALPSKFEGLGLPALEAMVCGAVPLVCSDNPNSKLCPDFCVAEPNIESVTKTYNGLVNHFSHYQSVILDEWSSQIQHKFSKFSVAKNIINLYEKYNDN